MSDVHMDEVVLLVPSDAAHSDLERYPLDLAQRLVKLRLWNDRADIDGHSYHVQRG